ncbi:hypothetical protein [Cerasicoccus maritimus]|uniref:hypothetical protein n=1 Tax=Cerasicoccus maritimus TaxID=490089 RepID=UPI0028528D5A|nr:hypothetical protein [Cerasicoccus maritimus]
MNSFNGITLGVLAGSLLFTGCALNNYMEKEHALKPLKEQLFSGEITRREYRDKKELLLQDYERKKDAMGMAARRDALRPVEDVHTVEPILEEKAEKADDAAIMAEDEKIIEEPPMEAVEPTKPMVEEPTKPTGTIDYGLLSRSIKAKDTPAASATTEPVMVGGEELVTDSKDVKWTKGSDGKVIYEDPRGAEMVEQLIQDAKSETPPAEVVAVPVADPAKAGETPTVDVKVDAPDPDATAEKVQDKVEEVKEEAPKVQEEPAKEEEEPVIMDFGDL